MKQVVMDDVRELLDEPALAMELEMGEAAALLAKVEGIAAVLRARLAAPDVSREGPKPGQDDDRLLTAEEVGRRFGLSTKQVYRRCGSWPFTRRVGKRTLRFSERGLRQWMTAQGRVMAREAAE